MVNNTVQEEAYRMEKENKIAEKYSEIMDLLGICQTDDNTDTPIRVAKSLMEMTSSLDWKAERDLKRKCTTFENKSHGTEIEVKDIEYASMCSHHHLPFFGKVDITYVANDKILGLSKFDRVVRHFSRRPQVQEDFTMDILNFLGELLDPIYLKVTVKDSTHSCMCARGVHSQAKTTTSLEFGKRP